MMKVIVIGPGALGCLFSFLLKEKDACEISLLDHDPSRAALLLEKGLWLEDDSGARKVNVCVTADWKKPGQADLILLCVKSHAVEQTLQHVGPLCGPQTILVTLQNGIAHLEILRSWRNCGWATGITAQGATLLGAGRIRHAGKGPTRIGFFIPPSPMAEKKLRDFAVLLNTAGIFTSVEEDIISHIWSKLLINAGINAITAIHDCPNGELLQRQDLRTTMLAAVREAAAVARALGVKIAGDPEERIVEVTKATAVNISSMLQDVRKHRKTEIEAINGEIVMAAKTVGIAVPVNEQLLSQVRALEPSADNEERELFLDRQRASA